jgi:CRP/FNR family transcriptional regulator, anaerobic regulatory protein
MNTERLLAVLSAIHPLSEQFKKEIEKVATPLSLPQNYVLLEAPRISGHAYFLLEGFAMSYIFIKGQKYVESFWNPGEIIVSVKSFFEQVPSREFIQLRDNSEILCFSHADVARLFETLPEANSITA